MSRPTKKAAALAGRLVLAALVAMTSSVSLPGRVAHAQTPPAQADATALADSLHPDVNVRRRAAVALGSFATPQATERLWMMAQADRDPTVRIAAIEALAMRRDPQLAPALRHAATYDPDPGVRAAAAHQAEFLKAFDLSPGWASFLGALCAGCGHLYIGEDQRGLAYLGPWVALMASGLLLASGDDLKLFGETEGPRTTPTYKPLALPLLSAGSNLALYSAFDAYRRVRLRRNNEGYRYPVSREGLLDLTTAPFRPRVLARPWFWAGIPAIFGSLVAYSLLADESLSGDKPSRSLTDGGGVWFLGRRYGNKTGIALAETYWASLFLPVGVGEEAFFRGVLQPAMIEQFGVWQGWAVASLIFGGVHIFNFTDSLSDGLWALPVITAVGGYMGAVSIKTGFQLETSVALHFWYDFLIGTMAFIADPDHQPFAVRIRLPL